ncbi:hypothetical protein K435DRAFT_231260 [Dendrothele bispora CBS 962.96]|uniref:Secreted protein n=1 Tax=Dendrothele bispora (strain CBS 962.96) TaxID=1314807 RepID=A0A4S8LQ14_DENBC|nr:hypothetical protein K435DRAFT_231260 [Dendrothele bispora CBS 962.96]
MINPPHSVARIVFFSFIFPVTLFSDTSIYSIVTTATTNSSQSTPPQAYIKYAPKSTWIHTYTYFTLTYICTWTSRISC